MPKIDEEIELVKQLLRDNTQPIFYLSRFGAHLRGVERFVPSMTCIFIRGSEGGESFPRQYFSPLAMPKVAPGPAETVNWLLANEEVQEYIAAHTPAGMRPKVVFSMHDEETERLSAELGYDVMSTPIALRTKLDSKLYLAERAQAAGLNLVPHVVTVANDWQQLTKETTAAGIGTDLVIQTAWGEGGEGTWFVADAGSFDAVKDRFAGQQVRAMKRVNHQPLAIEAVVTKGGVIVGPLERDIIGHKEVAKYEGSSSGLEYFPEILDDAKRALVVQNIIAIGEIFAAEGFRGLFEADFLLDTDTGEVYFGEANPRFSGCGMVSNSTTQAVWGLPLYALHLYEFLDIDHSIDVAPWNETWKTLPAGNEWTNALIRHLDPRIHVDTQTARTGTYRLNERGTLDFVSPGSDWFDLEGDDMAFYLSFHWPGALRVSGDTMGILFVRGKLQDDDAQFTPEAKRLIAAVHGLYRMKPLSFAMRAKQSIVRRVSTKFAQLRQSRM